MAVSSLQRFDQDGIELIIDTQTGESFASQAGYARMSGVDYSTIRKRVERLGVTLEPLKRSQIETVDGFRAVTLIPEDLICQWLVKDNLELALKVMQLGVRLFLHTLAGFRVKSEAIAEVKQLESQIVKLSEEKQILEELIKTQKTMIADFSSKNSMLDYKRLVIEELHAEKERDIAKFNLLETEREKARGWRGGRMLMRNDKKR
jgi:membrane-bound lytic murein transglycosylase MltF